MENLEFHHAEIQSTSDGSSTLVHAVLGELYHSRHGAWAESHHIYMDHGLNPMLSAVSGSIRIFEMGFGSGLNAALTREEADRTQRSVDYTTVELYPVDLSTVKQMHMPDQSNDERQRWWNLHQLPWGEEITVSPYFTIRKLQVAFPEISDSISGKYQLIYYDAFAPAAQPELWSVETLSVCYDLMDSGGFWLSYCAKGQVRRNLKQAGFDVEALPGPPGKREITRAVKPHRS